MIPASHFFLFEKGEKNNNEICSQLLWRNTLGRLSVPLLVPDAFSRTQTVVDIRFFFEIACDRMRSHEIACDRMRSHAISCDRMRSHGIACDRVLSLSPGGLNSTCFHFHAGTSFWSKSIFCERCRSDPHEIACDRMRSQWAIFCIRSYVVLWVHNMNSQTPDTTLNFGPQHSLVVFVSIFLVC